MLGVVNFYSSTPAWAAANMAWSRLPQSPVRVIAPVQTTRPPLTVVITIAPAPPSWHLCLACDTELGAQFSRRTGLCPSCHATNDEHRLAFYAKAMAFWRKMHQTGFRRKAFVAAPSPWQVTLFRLAQILLGFRGTLTSVGTKREGADSKLGTSAEELREMQYGSRPISAHVRQRLADIGYQWLKDLRDMEQDSKEDREWLEDKAHEDMDPRKVEAEL